VFDMGGQPPAHGTTGARHVAVRECCSEEGSLVKGLVHRRLRLALSGTRAITAVTSAFMGPSCLTRTRIR
jgi:hypothetical protein